ncbi:hypothetical protein QCA50_008233 [Cerrena zonata]|uniref:DUF6533 domain-containing protein n=1 Tax=Cerrena zonata TaxID=2478898 RepID=A0AAW0G5F1_9APHY
MSNLEEVISAISENHMQTSILFSALVYDAALTFPMEIKFIWQRKFGTVGQVNDSNLKLNDSN